MRRAVVYRWKFVGLAALLALVVSQGVLVHSLLDDESVTVTAALGGSFDSHLEEIDVGISGEIGCPAISPDELTLYFVRWESSPRNNPNIYFVSRERRDEPFSTPAREVRGLNTEHEEWLGAGSLSADNREIFFYSSREVGNHFVLWMARFNRPGDPDGGFHDIENLGSGVNTAKGQMSPSISQDGLRLYFNGPGRLLYVATRELRAAPFGEREGLRCGLGQVFTPSISADELVLFYTRWRRGESHEADDICFATRSQTFDSRGRPVPFGDPVKLPSPINSDQADWAPCVTSDWPASGSGLYFTRGTRKIFRATWHPDSN